MSYFRVKISPLEEVEVKANASYSCGANVAMAQRVHRLHLLHIHYESTDASSGVGVRAPCHLLPKTP